MSPYAEGTSVPIEESRNSIEKLLMRYDAESFAYLRESRRTVIAFRMFGRNMQLQVLNALPTDKAIAVTERGRERTPAQAEAAAKQETRRRWRGLLLILKAKIEAIHTGIVTPEEEFLAYTMLPDGRTVGQWAPEGLKPALEAGKMPLTLEGGR